MTESEWHTRKPRIDTRLRSVNPRWRIVRYRYGFEGESITVPTCPHARS
jgi:hypothetical protein